MHHHFTFLTGLLLAILAVGLVIPFVADRPWARGSLALIEALVWRVGALVGGLVVFRYDPEPAAAAAGALAGSAVAFTLSWLKWIPCERWMSVRQGSVVATLEQRALLFRAALCIAGAAMLARSATNEGLVGIAGRELAIVALFPATLVLLIIWGAHAATLLKLARWAPDAHRSEAPIAALAHTTDLGVGDERWVVGARGGSVYRDGQRASVLVLGSLHDAIARSARAVVRGAPFVMFALLSLGLAMRPPREPEPDHETRLYQRPASTAVAAPKERATDFRTYVGWYPQPGAIIEDLNGDGVEDVIGLRWDSSHQAAALNVIATDGKTFQPIWSTEALPSQWYNRSTHLLRSGDAIFVTDSEGLAHAYGIRDGKPRMWSAAPSVMQVCAAPTGAPRIFIRSDWDKPGVEIDDAGHATPTKVPDWCSFRQQEACPSKNGAVCLREGSRPRWYEKQAEYGSFYEEDGVGIAVAKPNQASAKFFESKAPTLLFGYDPKTLEKTYEIDLPFDASALHAEPHFESTLESGRLFAYYQLRTGQWVLGARDAKTGEALWHEAPPRSDHGTSFESMVASAHRLYLALDNRLEVFDAASGRSLGVVW